MKKLFYIGIFCLVSSTFFSCKPISDKKTDGTDATTALHIKTPDVNITDYGNGVYRFETTSENFGPALSEFLSDTTRHLITFSPLGRDNSGYFVVIKN